MTFPPLPTRNEFSRCGCGAILSEDAHKHGLSCVCTGSDGCPVCGDPPLLGASGTRSEIDVRHGVLVAHTSYVGPSRGEICLLPFLVSPVSSRVSWDFCHIVRIGPSLALVDPWRELEPLEHSLEGRRIHIEKVNSRRAPLVQERLRAVDLVVGVDERTVDMIARLPVPDDADVAILADDVPWAKLYGREFAPLDTWWDPEPVQSTLRLAALMGYVLDLGVDPAREGLRPIEHLMSKFWPPEVAYPFSVLDEEMSHARA